MSDKPPVLLFSAPEGARVICRICRGSHGHHARTCPLVALDTEIRELAGHVGLCVANIKESLDAIGRLLRDERPHDQEDRIP